MWNRDLNWTGQKDERRIAALEHKRQLRIGRDPHRQGCYHHLLPVRVLVDAIRHYVADWSVRRQGIADARCDHDSGVCMQICGLSGSVCVRDQSSAVPFGAAETAAVVGSERTRTEGFGSRRRNGVAGFRGDSDCGDIGINNWRWYDIVQLTIIILLNVIAWN